MQVLEGSTSDEHPEDELELLEGVTVKPDWQVCTHCLQLTCMLLHSLASAAPFDFVDRWRMLVCTCQVQHRHTLNANINNSKFNLGRVPPWDVVTCWCVR